MSEINFRCFIFTMPRTFQGHKRTVTLFRRRSNYPAMSAADPPPPDESEETERTELGAENEDASLLKLWQESKPPRTVRCEPVAMTELFRRALQKHGKPLPFDNHGAIFQLARNL